MVTVPINPINHLRLYHSPNNESDHANKKQNDSNFPQSTGHGAPQWESHFVGQGNSEGYEGHHEHMEFREHGWAGDLTPQESACRAHTDRHSCHKPSKASQYCQANEHKPFRSSECPPGYVPIDLRNVRMVKHMADPFLTSRSVFWIANRVEAQLDRARSTACPNSVEILR